MYTLPVEKSCKGARFCDLLAICRAHVTQLINHAQSNYLVDVWECMTVYYLFTNETAVGVQAVSSGYICWDWRPSSNQPLHITSAKIFFSSLFVTYTHISNLKTCWGFRNIFGSLVARPLLPWEASIFLPFGMSNNQRILASLIDYI